MMTTEDKLIELAALLEYCSIKDGERFKNFTKGKTVETESLVRKFIKSKYVEEASKDASLLELSQKYKYEDIYSTIEEILELLK